MACPFISLSLVTVALLLDLAEKLCGHTGQTAEFEEAACSLVLTRLHALWDAERAGYMPWDSA